MKKVLMFALVILGAITFTMQDALARPEKPERPVKINAVSRLAHAGDITGNAECFGVDPAQGTRVYLAGTSFMAVTDSNGDFTIFNVPKGTYDVYVETDGDPTTVEGSIEGFTVVGKTVNKLCDGN
ncbi:MAG: carboxypeptidase-like regulatory domain-containing protein [Syntrophobacteraceae bacterium]|jgi:hypothetical protein|nr:carboxypeptidase-like regulatory domain-containing protein [Syntrophobacteraceae bacterium]